MRSLLSSLAATSICRPPTWPPSPLCSPMNGSELWTRTIISWTLGTITLARHRFLMIISHLFFIIIWILDTAPASFFFSSPLKVSSLHSLFSPLLSLSFSLLRLDGPTPPCHDRRGTVCATATVSFARTGTITRIKVSSLYSGVIR